MESKCFCLNVFYILFVICTFTVETLSDSDAHYVTHDVNIPDCSIYCTHTFVPLERTIRQVPAEKKNYPASGEKAKITKKPTSTDSKPTNILGDGDQKPKTGVWYKKESLSTKVMASTPPSEVTPAAEEGHDKQMEHDHVDEILTSSTETLPLSTASQTPSTKPPNSKIDPILTNINTTDGDIQVNRFLESDFDDKFNETIRDHNITAQKVDHHLYYNSSVLSDPEVYHRYWVDMDKQKDVKDILAKSHRKAVTVKLNFEFPFYSHLISKITIATGGFLYTGEYAHSWLSVTQYIAPLMANFATSSSNSSSIRYVDNGTAFTVQWVNVVLKDKPEEGNFTFQCSLFKNGDIVFVYKHISVVIDSLSDNHHPIKVGVSDAYIIDRTIFFIRKKTIYEYHRVNIEKNEIRNETVILLNALDTCLDMKDCQSCLTEIPNFECNWCANRCSNGMDRYRQEWLVNGCNNKKKISVDECLAEEEPLSVVSKTSKVNSPEVDLTSDNSMSIGIAGIMGILFVICLALGVGIWLFYGYRNPHTPAGQFLIRYRPSQWSWRRGEARYTAATIHM